MHTCHNINSQSRASFLSHLNPFFLDLLHPQPTLSLPIWCLPLWSQFSTLSTIYLVIVWLSSLCLWQLTPEHDLSSLLSYASLSLFFFDFSYQNQLMIVCENLVELNITISLPLILVLFCNQQKLIELIAINCLFDLLFLDFTCLLYFIISLVVYDGKQKRGY